MPLVLNPAVQILQLQDLGNVGTAQTTRQLYCINNVLYFVTKRQIPTLSADNHWVVFKSTNGTTWTLSANVLGCAANPMAQSISFGTKIYMVDNDNLAGPSHVLQIWTYDTVTGLITGPSSNSPISSHFALNTQLAISALNSGSLVVTCTDEPNGPGNELLESIAYNPLTDTWGAFTVVNSRVQPTGSQVFAQMHDPTTDETFGFYILDNSVTPKAVQCFTLNNLLALINTTPTIFTTTRPFIETWGPPCITSDSPTGNPSIAFPFKTGGSPAIPLNMGFIDIATFATAIEAVDNSSDLPVGWLVTPYSALDVGGWSSYDFGGVLYCLFQTDNGNNNDGTSQSSLYAKSRVLGVWGGLQQLFLSTIPNEPSTPYPVTCNGQPAIIFNLFDPTLGVNNLASLTSWILLGPQAPPPPSGRSISIQPANFLSLPEPCCLYTLEKEHCELYYLDQVLIDC